MAASVKSLLGGRYKLSGELVRGPSLVRGWDRWLDRRVFIKIFANAKIDGCAAQRRFIDSSQALIRIEHPNVEALLDFGSTDAGAPYHVLGEAGVDLATLLEREGKMSWARVRGIVLDVIAGVAALHLRRITNMGIAPHTVALVGETARLVEFGDAMLCEHEPTHEQRGADVRRVAALAITLLTGVDRLDLIGRTAVALDDALARAEAPAHVRAVLVRALTEPEAVELESLRRQLAGESRRRARLSNLIDVGAAVAAAGMLSIGLWSSAGSLEHLDDPKLAISELPASICEGDSELRLASVDAIEAPMSLARPSDLDLDHQSERRPEQQIDRQSDEINEAPILAVQAPSPRRDFAAAHARVAVGSQAQRELVAVHSQRLDLHHQLSPEIMVERGIDLTHGRPTPEDDPRLPVVDGPLRARALFEAACARDYGKGCHMLGVQIAENMVPDDGAGPAAHYHRGCELNYHRSCAALAELARAGEIDAEADSLTAKACLLAGAGSSYCRPRAQ